MGADENDDRRILRAPLLGGVADWPLFFRLLPSVLPEIFPCIICSPSSLWRLKAARVPFDNPLGLFLSIK